MLQQTNYFFFSELRQSNTIRVLNSYFENLNQISFKTIMQKKPVLKKILFSSEYENTNQREVINCVLKDMIYLCITWRHIRGYPTKGNTTHTNAKTARKNKLLLNFRIQQFFLLYGKKSRNIYPTLVKAEYTNRLWWKNWSYEYAQAASFSLKMAEAGNKAAAFNPALLAANQVNGFTREGNASKLGKAKRLTKVYTLGVPLMFANYIYLRFTPIGFPRIILKDDVNKQLGKKLRRRQYRY